MKYPPHGGFCTSVHGFLVSWIRIARCKDISSPDISTSIVLRVEFRGRQDDCQIWWHEWPFLTTFWYQLRPPLPILVVFEAISSEQRLTETHVFEHKQNRRCKNNAKTTRLSSRWCKRDWYFIAEQPAPAPQLAHPEECAALRNQKDVQHIVIEPLLMKSLSGPNRWIRSW